MRLIYFLSVISALVGLLGEFGQFPFGSTNSVSLLDIGSVVTVGLLVVWQIGIVKKLQIPRVYLWLVGFMLCGVVGAVGLGVWSGLVYLVRFGVYSLWVWVGYVLVRSKVAKLTDLEKLLQISGIFLLLGGIGQMIWAPNLKLFESFGFDPHINRMTGLFLDPNFFGALLVVGWAVSLNRFLLLRHKVDLVLIMLLGLGIVMSFSRSAYLMWLIVIILLGMKSRKVLLVVFIIGMMLFLGVPRLSERVVGGLRVDASAKERMVSWQKGVEIWKISPIFGIGFDNVRELSVNRGWLELYSRDGGNSGAGVDSSILLVLATSGTVGLICFGGFWVNIARMIWKRAGGWLFLSVLCGLLVESWFVNSLFLPIMMMWAYLWAGMLIAKD